MQGMHRRSRQHGSPATQEVGERSSNKITVRAAMQKTPGLVRGERRHIVVEERSGPWSSCVITFLGRASMRTKERCQYPGSTFSNPCQISAVALVTYTAN